MIKFELLYETKYENCSKMNAILDNKTAQFKIK
jgi:hypothetical protein